MGECIPRETLLHRHAGGVALDKTKMLTTCDPDLRYRIGRNLNIYLLLNASSTRSA